MLIITRKRNTVTLIDNKPLTVARYNPDQLEVTYKGQTRIIIRNRDAELDDDVTIGYFGIEKYKGAKIGFEAPDHIQIVRDDARVKGKKGE